MWRPSRRLPWAVILFLVAWVMLRLLERARPWVGRAGGATVVASIITALLAPGAPRKVRWGTLGVAISWFGMWSLEGYADGWPWRDRPASTALLALILVTLATGLFVSGAILAGGIVEWQPTQLPRSTKGPDR